MKYVQGKHFSKANDMQKSSNADERMRNTNNLQYVYFFTLLGANNLAQLNLVNQLEQHWRDYFFHGDRHKTEQHKPGI